MKIQEVRQRVNEIRQRAGDPEVAHAMEDQLYRDVLAGIAADPVGGSPARRLAKTALAARDIDFPRWYS